MFDFLEEGKGIVATHERVGRIELDTEMRRVHLLDDLEKDVLGLSELRIPPRAVLVVVLEAQHDITALGILERPPQAIDRARDTFGARHAWITLAAQSPAVPGPEAHRQIDRGLLTLDLSAPLVGIGVCEVRRKTDHRRDLTGFSHHADDRVHVGWGEAAEESVVVLDAFAAERAGVPDPLLVRAAAIDQV